MSASQAAAVGGKVAQIYIPTPDAIQSSINYDRLYHLTFPQPATYIRFSSTVEDCCGCPYDLDDEDDAYLKSMNRKRNASTQCSEDQFEEVMDVLEKTAQLKQPFAAVDNPPVLTLEEMEPAFDDELTDSARPFVKEIYEHWKTRRLRTHNKILVPSLKVRPIAFFPTCSWLIEQFETGAETDDSDPYVCFRRREVRAIRKTRGRDAHSAEKLKKMRKELEEARKLLESIRQRELLKREQLAVDRQLFEQRASLRQVKLNLPEQYKEGDEDLLINQKVNPTLMHLPVIAADLAKPPKRKQLDITTQRAAASQLRQQQKSDGRSVESDLLTLQEYLEHKEAQIQEQIDMRVAQHKKWNEGWVDLTRAPLTPPLEANSGSTFRTATTEYLPTPPASASSEHLGDTHKDVDPTKRHKLDPIPVRYASPSYDGPWQSQPSFRRRIGRGGRLMIDRRGMRLRSKDELEHVDDIVVDRFKYDRDDDEEDEVPTYVIDPNDISSMRYRAKVTQQLQAVRNAELQRQHAAAQAPAQLSATSGRLPGPDG